MSQTVVQLGQVPVNRGEFVLNPITRYYKDNIVQYENYSFIADPVAPATYVTTPPINSETGALNPGWRYFSGTGVVDEKPKAESENVVTSGGVYDFAAEVGEVVGDPAGDWEPESAEKRFEELQDQIRIINNVVTSTQLAVGAMGVDLEPIQGSGNIVTSGTIYTERKKLEDKITTNATNINNVDAKVDSTKTNLESKINSEASTRANADAALANRVSTLEEEIGTGGSGESLTGRVEALEDKVGESSVSDQISSFAEGLAKVATSGSYNDLEDKPTIPVVPTEVSAFNNDAGYLTQHQSLAGYSEAGEVTGTVEDEEPEE